MDKTVSTELLSDKQTKMGGKKEGREREINKRDKREREREREREID